MDTVMQNALDFFASNAWATWMGFAIGFLLVLFVDYIVVLIVSIVLTYFCGVTVGDKIANIIGFPITITVDTIGKIWEGLTFPWRYRNRRLFKEIFGFYQPNPYLISKLEKMLMDQKLRGLAQDMEWTFKKQEEVRHKKYTSIGQKEIDLQVSASKQAFKEAIRIAWANGITVEKDFHHYLAMTD